MLLLRTLLLWSFSYQSLVASKSSASHQIVSDLAGPEHPASDTAAASHAEPDSSKKTFNLLSLDGGGVKGISSVIILEAIMKQILIEQRQEDGAIPDPHEYFDLAGGTSTGGLAAVMMFRLKKSTGDTKTEYQKMAKSIFSPMLGSWLNLHWFGKLGYWTGNPYLWLKAMFSEARFSAKPLEAAINEVTKNESMLLRDEKGPKMLMCSTFRSRGETMLFRSYEPPNTEDAAPVSSDLQDVDLSDVKVWEAALATSAAPIYFPEATITRRSRKTADFMIDLKFWDGGLLNNNPIDQVWNAGYDLVDQTNETPVVRCVVSIGTGFCDPKPLSSWHFADKILGIIGFATNTEAKHHDFERNLRRMNARLPLHERTKYFRFNVPTKERDFGLDDWQSMAALEKVAEKYIETDSDVRDKIRECAQALISSRQGVREPLKPHVDGAKMKDNEGGATVEARHVHDEL